MASEGKEIILLELFSGIGGFAKGFEDAGYTIKKHWFSEIDKHAIANYKYNFKDAEYIGSVTNVRHIIRTINAGRKPTDKLIITFGSPCQDFSLAGKRLGMAGKRSSLITFAIFLIKWLRPDVYIWENVKGAYSSNAGADYWAIIQAFTNLNDYRCEQQLLNTAWFLPQNRERIYLIGHLTGRSEFGVFPITESTFGNADGGPATEATNVRTLTGGGNSGGHHSGMALFCIAQRGSNPENPSDRTTGAPTEQRLEENSQGTTNTLTGVTKDNLIKIEYKDWKQSQDNRIHLTHGLAPALGSSSGASKPKVEVMQLNASKESNGNQPYQQNRGIDDKGIIPALMADMSCGSHAVSAAAKIRRLTEIECERLQGFPDVDKICIFTVWKNHVEYQNNSANAEIQNHKKLSLVGSVERKDLEESVLSAQQNLNTKNQPIKKLAQQNVLISCEENKVEIRSQEKLILCVSAAEIKNRLALPTGIENFAHLLVLIISIQEKIILNGEAVYHLNDQRQIQIKSGNLHVNLFGKEITPLASSVKQDTPTTKKHTKSTTLNLLKNESLDTQFQTLFCYVMNAIRLFTPEKIQIANSLSVKIQVNHGWTAYGIYDAAVKEIPKTQRYKLCGNAVTKHVVRAIGERLNLLSF